MIRVATKDDFSHIAELIVEQSRCPERRCIHSDPRGSVEQAVVELEQLHAIGEILFVVSAGSEPVYGCVGAEFDLELQRAWLRGPFVATDDPGEWFDTGKQLLEALLKHLPAEITILDSFLDLANEWGQRLYLANGFERQRLVYVYQTDAATPLSRGLAGCIPMQPEHAERVAALHQQLFPHTYLTAQQIVAPADENTGNAPHKVFVYLEHDQVLGYVYGSENLGEGVVDFIGVDAAARRRGIGRALLSAILYWLQVEQGLDVVTLTVHEELVNARALYEPAGFRLLYTGVHRRKLR